MHHNCEHVKACFGSKEKPRLTSKELLILHHHTLHHAAAPQGVGLHPQEVGLHPQGGKMLGERGKPPLVAHKGELLKMKNGNWAIVHYTQESRSKGETELTHSIQYFPTFSMIIFTFNVCHLVYTNTR